MDFDKNVDQIYDFGLPTYGVSDRASGSTLIFDDYYFVDPWELEDFKDFARIDTDTDDNLLTLFLKSATRQCEQYLQKSLGIRTITLFALKLPKNYKLPFGPVSTITTANFTLFGDLLKEGGTDLEIEYITDDSLVNEQIINAIYKQALHNYEYREKFKDNPMGGLLDEVKLMLATYKDVTFP